MWPRATTWPKVLKPEPSLFASEHEMWLEVDLMYIVNVEQCDYDSANVLYHFIFLMSVLYF